MDFLFVFRGLGVEEEGKRKSQRGLAGIGHVVFPPVRCRFV